jgi:hypothetical protein
MAWMSAFRSMSVTSATTSDERENVEDLANLQARALWRTHPPHRRDQAVMTTPRLLQTLAFLLRQALPAARPQCLRSPRSEHQAERRSSARARARPLPFPSQAPRACPSTYAERALLYPSHSPRPGRRQPAPCGRRPKAAQALPRGTASRSRAGVVQALASAARLAYRAAPGQQRCGRAREAYVPPGAIKSAPPMRTGMTCAGVERKGRRRGDFQSVYTACREERERGSCRNKDRAHR